MHRFTRVGFGALAGAIALTGALAAAAPAGAATSGGPKIVPHTATFQCQVTPGCGELVVAIAANNNDFDPASDAAVSVFNGSQLFTRPNNNVHDGSQDMQLNIVQHVPFFGDGGLGLTAFDRSTWAGSPIAQNQWTPRGDDNANLCMNFGRVSQAGFLAQCGSGNLHKGQLFIVTNHVPGAGFSPPGYSFLVSVRQADLLAHHRVVTADSSGFGQLHIARAINQNRGQYYTVVP